MIKSIDDVDFSKYGKVCNMDFKEACRLNNFNKECITQINVSSKSIKSMKCLNSDILLNPIEGISLLCVSNQDEIDSPTVFIFSKPILIKGGINYNIVPLYGVCSVLIAKKSDSKTKKIALNEEFIPFGILPRININKIYTFFYQSKDANFKFKGEKHNFWEMTYVDKGTLISIVDGIEYKNKQGEVTFYNENQYHIQKADEKSPVSFVTITFDMDFSESSAIANKTFLLNQDMRYTIERMLLEKKNLFYYDDLIICYLKILIINLIRTNRLENTIEGLDVDSKFNVESSIVDKAIEYIHDNIDKKLSLYDIAKYVHISQSYLSSIFKKNMKTTIINFINEYRLELSKELISSSNYNFTEISQKLGYNSIHYFSRQFKKYYGLSPSEFAKNSRSRQ